MCITLTIAYSIYVAGVYGVALAALGMLSSLPVALSIDAFGPIADNADRIAEISGLPNLIWNRTNALNVAGS